MKSVLSAQENVEWTASKEEGSAEKHPNSESAGRVFICGKNLAFQAIPVQVLCFFPDAR